MNKSLPITYDLYALFVLIPNLDVLPLLGVSANERDGSLRKPARACLTLGIEVQGVHDTRSPSCGCHGVGPPLEDSRHASCPARGLQGAVLGVPLRAASPATRAHDFVPRLHPR